MRGEFSTLDVAILHRSPQYNIGPRNHRGRPDANTRWTRRQVRRDRIDPPSFVESIVDNFPSVVGIIVALLAGRWLAAQIAGGLFGYSSAARMTMWSLTLPQVAATLAATLVAFHTLNPAGERLLDDRMLNVVLVLMLITSIVGPLLTQRFAPRLVEEHSANRAWSIVVPDQ